MASGERGRHHGRRGTACAKEGRWSPGTRGNGQQSKESGSQLIRGEEEMRLGWEDGLEMPFC